MSDNILIKEDILNMSEGAEVSGLVYIQSYQKLPQKNGGSYIGGNLQAKGSISFKAWSNSLAYSKLLNNEAEYCNKVCKIEGMINKYGGVTSLILSRIEVVESDLSTYDFMDSVYEADQWFTALHNILKKNCSDDAVALFDEIIKPVEDSFKNEFAAVSHHDACRSGLLAHTTKVVRMASMIKQYPEILKRVSPDLLFIGCALHDIGKIFEYNNGAISDLGKSLSHHTFGVIILLDNKELICSSMGESFFYSLLAVVEQHHGEYAEHPRTVASYVIYQLDNLDSRLTSLNSLLAESDGDVVQYDGYKMI